MDEKETDRVSYVAEVNGKLVRVTIVGNWDEDEFGNPLPPEPWWSRLLKRLGF
jgi:hypothetical protein